MIKNLKKAFTIIELVIVIAVIAILAAVMIPTYSSLVKKANQSADIQAVKQMNTILSTYVDGSIKNVTDAASALDKDDIDLEDYKPLQKNHYFYFYLDNNVPKIVYMDENDKVVYPNVTINSNTQLMSLSGDVPTDSNYDIIDGKVTIDSGAKLADLIETKKNTSDALEITLSGNVDLRGAAVDFGQTTGNITINGGSVENPATLSGLRVSDNTVSPTTGEFAGDKYGFGIFGEIKSGTVKLENVVISGLAVGYPDGTHSEGANTVGLVAGYIDAGATVNLTNVTFKDCSVYGYQKVGGVVGQLHGTLNMTNVKFENTNVNGYIETAKIAGYVNTGNLNVDNKSNFDGIKVNALGNSFGLSDFEVAQGKSIVFKGSNDNTFMYRIYLSENSDGSISDLSGVYNATTTDWVWYLIKKEDENCTLEYRENSVIYDGKTCFLNGSCCSASVNFKDGKPIE